MIIGSAIRHLATSIKQDVFLAALFEKTVYSWSLITGEKIAEYETILEFGGERLALANSHNIFIAGAYHRYGVASYRIEDGTKVWQRSDLKGLQTIRVSPDDKFIFCGFSDKPGHLLAFDTGETIDKLKGVRDVFFDPYSSCVVYDRHPHKPEIINTEYTTKLAIPAAISVFDVAFSPRYIVISSGDIHFIPRQSGDKEILIESSSGSYIEKISFCPKTNEFYGIQHNTLKRVAGTLLKYETLSDVPTIVTDIPRSDYAFCGNGEHLVVADGQYFNTSSGQVEMLFSFPHKEYNSYGIYSEDSN